MVEVAPFDPNIKPPREQTVNADTSTRPNVLRQAAKVLKALFAKQPVGETSRVMSKNDKTSNDKTPEEIRHEDRLASAREYAEQQKMRLEKAERERQERRRTNKRNPQPRIKPTGSTG